MADSKYKILVVDDDEDTRALLEFILSKADFEILLAGDGQAALDKIHTLEPADLVLLDILMPYLSGFDVLKEIKQNQEWHDVPVIMLTSKEDEEDIVRGFNQGITDYVTKPFKPAELVARIKRVLTSKA